MADKKKKKSFLNRWGLLIFYIGMLLLPIGTHIWRHWQIETEINRTLHSTEVHQLIEKQLKREDPKAFQTGGKIQSYTINYDSKKINPMGGIMFELYVNGDKELSISEILTKNTATNEYSLISSVSKKIQELVEDYKIE